MDVQFSKCACLGHKSASESPFDKDKVPIDLFEENGKLFKTCLHCRIYNQKRNKEYRQKAKDKRLIADKANKEFLYCTEISHGKSIPSDYPVDKVPVFLFRKEPKDPKSGLYNQCKDCRDYKAYMLDNWKKDKRREAAELNITICAHCHKEYDELSTSTLLCTSCHEQQEFRNNQRSVIYNEIKHDFMIKIEASCNKCKCIYLKPDGESLISVKLQTYELNGVRYVNLFENPYKAIDILNSDMIELSVTQLDHLTEDEQRQRALLLPHEQYIPKRSEVSNMNSKHAMYLEANKCQVLCIKCHIEETKRRKLPSRRDTIPILEEKKKEYVDGIRALGCSSCNMVYPDLLEFIDMDHLDPKSKIENISSMVRNSKYTLDNIINECKKCRVLCKHCHIIHTKRQYLLK